MTESKFVEILDVTDVPYSHANVSLDDVLAETRARSSSASSTGSTSTASNASSECVASRKSTSSEREPHATIPVKMRLRALSLRRPKS